MDTPPAAREPVLEHLQKVLASETFSGVARSRALLRFLVEQAVAGTPERLKEYTIGAEALGRGDAFDPRTDPIVRAEASRLRRRLERYYATEGVADRVAITLPKGTYVPGFLTRDAAAGAAVATGPRRSAGALQKVAWFALGALVGGGGLALSMRVRGPAEPGERVVPLTALPGASMWPTFSPDGAYVAFSWSGDKPGNLDIHVTMVGSSETRRITSDPAPDFGAEWSPDGRQIAYVRAAGPRRGAIHVVSPLGGGERKVSNWPVLFGPFGALSWSRDGRFLAATPAAPDDASPGASGIHLVPLDGGAPRPLTRAQPGGMDLAPAFSPDGRSLAFAACAARDSPCDVYLLGLGHDLVPRGAARRVTRQGLYSIHRLAWTDDGRALVYDTEEGGHETFYTWRVAADGASPPERLEMLGRGAWQPAVAGRRLAFTRWKFDVDILRFADDGPGAAFLASSYWDGSSQFSPDGRRVAFESMRSGDRQEVWLAEADGQRPVQLTRGPGRQQGSPAWSPDGRTIAFDSEGADGHWDVWSIELSGGPPRRLTRHAGDEHVPRWSRDGRYIYFGARREGRGGIWRIPAAGGAEEQVLALPAANVAVVQDSADGQTLYFTAGGDSPLVAHPLAGGAGRKVLDCVSGVKGFAATERALFWAHCAAAGSRGPGAPDARLHRLDLATGDARVLGTLAKFRGSLSVSPDEKTILYTSLTRTGADLMLVEGLR